MFAIGEGTPDENSIALIHHPASIRVEVHGVVTAFVQFNARMEMRQTHDWGTQRTFINLSLCPLAM